MISPGPIRWPPGAEERLVPEKSSLKPQSFACCLEYVSKNPCLLNELSTFMSWDFCPAAFPRAERAVNNEMLIAFLQKHHDLP